MYFRFRAIGRQATGTRLVIRGSGVAPGAGGAPTSDQFVRRDPDEGGSPGTSSPGRRASSNVPVANMSVLHISAVGGARYFMKARRVGPRAS